MNTTQHTLVVGLQFGDEGKGKIIDSLVDDFDAVVRFNGGANAGHTIYYKGQKIALHQIPSGVLNKHVLNIISHGLLLNLSLLVEEMNGLDAFSIKLTSKNFCISPLCTLVMPWHIAMDRATSGTQIGTTVKGIGPASADRINRRGIRLIDLFAEDFEKRFMDEGVIQNNILKVFGGDTLDLKKEYTLLVKSFEQIRGYVLDVYDLLNSLTKNNKRILFEAAQGMMLDVFNGTYPYVTSSVCDPSSVTQGTGYVFPLKKIGVLKPYLTVVGAREVPTEIFSTTADIIREKGNEYGATTGRPRRIGWIDIPMLRYVLQHGIDEFALMKLDVLTNIDEIQVCTAYWDVHIDEEIRYTPGYNDGLKHITKVYESFPAWKEDISGMSKFEDLPKNAKAFIKGIERYLDKKISYISTGVNKEDLIVR